MSAVSLITISPDSSPEGKPHAHQLRNPYAKSRKALFKDDEDLAWQIDKSLKLDQLSPCKIDIDEGMLTKELDEAALEFEPIQKAKPDAVAQIVAAVSEQNFSSLAAICKGNCKKNLFVLLNKAKMHLEKDVEKAESLSRIKNFAKIMVEDLDEEKQMSKLQAVLLALHIEQHIHKSGEPYYVPQTDQLARALILLPATRSFVVLSGEHANFQGSGAFKTITGCALFTLQGQETVKAETHKYVHVINTVVRGTSRAQAQKIALDMKKEYQLTQELNRARNREHEVLLALGFVNDRNKEQFCWVEERFDGNLNDFLTFAMRSRTAKKSTTLTQDEALLMLRLIAEELQFLHAKGIVHNDLDARNILYRRVNGRLQIKVIDIGNCYSFDGKYPREDAAGYGTSKLTAPEYFTEGAKLSDPLAQGKAEDMHAMGTLNYSLIFGKETDWATCTQRAVDDPSVKYTTDVREKHAQGYQSLQAMKFEDPFKQKLLSIALQLFNPKPNERLTVDQLLPLLKM